MTDKKLTDAEIKKALENAEYRVDGVVTRGFYLDHEFMEQLIDLINRLQAKVEALQMDNAQLQSDIINANMNCDHTQAENERLQKCVEKTDCAYFKKSLEVDNLTYDIDLLKQEKSVVKAEAYKVCAEKIKKKTLAMIYSPDEITTDEYIKCIDDAVKELEGETDG